jgi:hypothetical protein
MNEHDRERLVQEASEAYRLDIYALIRDSYCLGLLDGAVRERALMDEELPLEDSDGRRLGRWGRYYRNRCWKMSRYANGLREALLDIFEQELHPEHRLLRPGGLLHHCLRCAEAQGDAVLVAMLRDVCDRLEIEPHGNYGVSRPRGLSDESATCPGTPEDGGVGATIGPAAGP